MSAEPTLTLSHADPRAILRGVEPALCERMCREYLEGRGWLVQWPREWETPAAFCARLGICYQTLDRSLRRRGCPPVALHRGNNGHGRLVELAPTRAFEEFCVRNKKAQKKQCAAYDY
jgi:hypothetical protein